jgi:hypothetical protein
MHGSTILVKIFSAMSHDSVFTSIGNDTRLGVVQSISKFVMDSGKTNDKILPFKPIQFQVDGTTMLGSLTMDKMDPYKFVRKMTLRLYDPNSRIYSDACAFLVGDVFNACLHMCLLHRECTQMMMSGLSKWNTCPADRECIQRPLSHWNGFQLSMASTRPAHLMHHRLWSTSLQHTQRTC